MNKIEKKIISYKVVNKDKEEEIKQSEDILPTDRVIEIIPAQSMVESRLYMGEHVERLEILDGKTYKIKPSTSEHAYYITINNIEIDGKLHPYEIFINSKGLEHYKLLGFARLVSAIFRKGGDISFLCEELKQIYDPTGTYTSKRVYESGKRKRFNSIEAEIGDIIEEHLFYLTNINYAVEAVSKMILDDTSLTTEESWELYDTPSDTGFPPNATICPKCSYKAVVILDGCATCLQCGDSKCS